MEKTATLHELTFPEIGTVSYSKARYHYVIQIIYGETLAIDYCSRIAEFAPNEEARNFLLEQQEEENLHLELLTEYVTVHSRYPEEVSGYFSNVHMIMNDAIEQKDYVTAIFIQNFLVEGLVVTLLSEFEHHTDSELSALSRRILNDERKHLEFGLSEMKRILQKGLDKGTMRKIRSVHRTTFLNGVFLAISLLRESNRLGIPMPEFSRNVIDQHLSRVYAAKFPLSLVDKMFFFSVKFVLSFF